MSGKGSKRRPGDRATYSASWDRIFAREEQRSAEIDTLIDEMRQLGGGGAEISAVILDRYGETYVLED